MDINIINGRIIELKKNGEALLGKKKELLDELQRTEAVLLKVTGGIEELIKLVQNKEEEKK